MINMSISTAQDILRLKGWRLDESDGLWWHPRFNVGYTEAEALEVEARRDGTSGPAPRPTCGTCPHYVGAGQDEGLCQHDPPKIVDFRNNQCDPYYGKYPFVGAASPGCGQHPEMPAWIRDEWPKVKR